MKKIVRSYKIISVCFIIISFITISSCRKEGLGGKSSVSGFVKHHEKIIPNAKVYIKYNATEFPGTNTAGYDNYTTADINAHYEFKNLRKGDYYLYGVGYDDAILEEVVGGIPVELKYNKHKDTDVPVTE